MTDPVFFAQASVIRAPLSGQIEVAGEFLTWWRQVDPDRQESLTDRAARPARRARPDLLAERGRALGRPVADR